VPYKDQKSRDQFDNNRGGASSREDFRGRDAQRDQARNTLDKHGANPAEGRKDLKGSGGDRARDSVNKANRDVAQGNRSAGNRTRDTGQTRNAGNKTRDAGKTRSSSSNRTQSHSRNNALKGSGNAQRSHQSVNRGRSSNRSMSSRGGGRRR
jgi:hypothetical protein